MVARWAALHFHQHAVSRSQKLSKTSNEKVSFCRVSKRQRHLTVLSGSVGGFRSASCFRIFLPLPKLSEGLSSGPRAPGRSAPASETLVVLLHGHAAAQERSACLRRQDLCLPPVRHASPRPPTHPEQERGRSPKASLASDAGIVL